MKLYMITAALASHCVMAMSGPLNLQGLPDDARATVVKELARKRLMEAQYGQSDPSGESPVSAAARKKDECKMDINSDAQPSAGGRRNTTTVITGSVVQICGR